MRLTEKHIKRFALFYLVCILLNQVWLFANNLLLSGINPVFFINKLDITRNVLMATGLQKAILYNKALCVVFDILLPLFPIALYYVIASGKRGRVLLSIATAIFSLIYFLLLTGVSYLCIEGYIAFLLLPLVFSAGTPRAFYYRLHCLRILFLIIFFSSGLWKIRTGAIFNTEQMSGILLLQHAGYLVSNANDWFSRFIYFLVEHPVISYSLYLLATAIELSFAIGFFTKKYDRLFIILFCLFVAFDYFLMRINYFSWIAFTGCLYFSKYTVGDKTISSKIEKLDPVPID